MSAEGADDDDMIVVLISEDDGKNHDNQQHDDMIIDEVTGELISPTQIKREVINDPSFDEDLFEAVQKYGTPVDMQIPLKQEQIGDGFECEYLDDESQDSDYVPEEQEEVDEVSDKEYSEKHTVTKKNTKKIAYQHRSKLLAPNESYSFVEELRTMYPEFVDDQESLILHLAKLIKGLKPPPPPDGYCDFTHPKQYECTLCPKISETKAASERHYAEKHGPRYLNCYSCGVDFRCLTNLYKHEKRCLHPDAEFVLRARAICVGFKGANRPYLECYQTKALTPSALEQTGKQRYECGTCYAVFQTRCNLKAHESIHAGERPYTCDQCAVSYTSKARLQRHLHRHSGVKFECDICGRVYPLKSSIASHMDAAHNDNRFLCPYGCGRKYSSNFALRIHIDGKHLNKPPPCACNICPKRFFKMSLLKVHMKKAHSLLLMTRNMIRKQLPRMEPEQVKALFGDASAAYVHKGSVKAEEDAYELVHEQPPTSSDALDVHQMELAQFELEGETHYTNNLPDIGNPDSDDAPVITGDFVNFSDEFSEELLQNNSYGNTFNNGNITVQIKEEIFDKENYDVPVIQDIVPEVRAKNKYRLNIDNEGMVVIKEECQNITLEEVLRSNTKFKVIMINK